MGVSGTSLLNAVSLMAYNVFYTSIPVLVSLVDKDLSEGTVMQHPQILYYCQAGRLLNSRTFAGWFGRSQFHVVDWMSKLWRVRTIGPTLPFMYLDQQLKDDTDYGINLFKPHSSVCMNWLNAKPCGSVVYVSFGSMAAFESKQMQDIAWGLNQNNYNFLGVVRATEEAKLPNNFINDTAEKGLVVTWSPQLEVLAHESIGCFVTHCGFNTILEALSLGVPMVGVPYWSDQATNAKFVEDVWGIGIRAKMDDKGIVRRDVLEACMKEVIEGEKKIEVKMNAMKWKKLAKEGIGDGGSSDKNIDEFVG